MHVLSITDDEDYGLTAEPGGDRLNDPRAMRPGAVYGYVTIAAADVSYDRHYDTFTVSDIAIASTTRGVPPAVVGPASRGIERLLYDILAAQILARYADTLDAVRPSGPHPERLLQKELL